LEAIMAKKAFQAVYTTRDYTPYAVSRDRKIEKWCRDKEIRFECVTDIMLIGDREVLTSNGSPYQIYGPFYRKAKELPVEQPNKARLKPFLPAPNRKWSLDRVVPKLIQEHDLEVDDTCCLGGRSKGRQILRAMDWKHYLHVPDDKSTETGGLPISTSLSPHNKFGTLSIREIYHAVQSAPPAVRIAFRGNLYWRDFHYYCAMHHPRFFQYVHMFHEPKGEPSTLWCSSSETKVRFRAWRRGLTGYPIVDAGMRQLRQEGYLNNRVRLIVAEFLAKTIRVNWKYGEQHFTRHLTDIDRTQNMGNWNWAASMGLDHTQFLRIFNPWTQGSKFDPQATYIRRWVPELADLTPKQIHQWKTKQVAEIDYPAPIVSHEEQSKLFKDAWYSLYRDS
jgi:deoxyribodipyrimidine photo-lyase